jgi:hypothetical protein
MNELMTVGSALAGSKLRRRKYVRHMVTMLCILLSFALVSALSYYIYLLATGDANLNIEGTIVIARSYILTDHRNNANNLKQVYHGGHCAMLIVSENNTRAIHSRLTGVLLGRHSNDAIYEQSHMKDGIDYRVHARSEDDNNDDYTRLNSVDIHWAPINLVHRPALDYEKKVDALNLWIERHLDDHSCENSSIIVCCVDGAKQCNALAAMYLMYTKCWDSARASLFLKDNTQSEGVDYAYSMALREYRVHLKTTKC